MQKLKKVLIQLLAISLFVLPLFVFAQPINPGTLSPATEESGTGITYSCVQAGAGLGGTDLYGNCNFNNLIAAVSKFFKVAIPMALAFSVVIIAYAGFLYMTSGDNASKRS